MLLRSYLSTKMVALIMAIYTIRCFTVFSVKKKKEKAKDLQKPEFSDALDSSHALYDYFLNRNHVCTCLLRCTAVFSLLLRCLCTTIFTGMRQSFDQQYVSDDDRFCNADKTGHDTCSEAIFNCCCICCLQPDSAGDCGESRFLSRLGIVYGIIGLGLFGSVFILVQRFMVRPTGSALRGIGFQPSRISKKIIFVFL